MSIPSETARPARRPAPSAARVEAEGLYRLVQAGRETISSVRKLIAISGGLDEQLKNIDSLDAKDRKKLLDMLKFRKQVREEFERLVAEGPCSRDVRT